MSGHSACDADTTDAHQVVLMTARLRSSAGEFRPWVLHARNAPSRQARRSVTPSQRQRLADVDDLASERLLPLVSTQIDPRSEPWQSSLVPSPTRSAARACWRQRARS